jgi:hypothetical protein
LRLGVFALRFDVAAQQHRPTEFDISSGLRQPNDSLALARSALRAFSFAEFLSQFPKLLKSHAMDEGRADTLADFSGT